MVSVSTFSGRVVEPGGLIEQVVQFENASAPPKIAEFTLQFACSARPNWQHWSKSDRLNCWDQKIQYVCIEPPFLALAGPEQAVKKAGNMEGLPG